MDAKMIEEILSWGAVAGCLLTAAQAAFGTLKRWQAIVMCLLAAVGMLNLALAH